MTHGYLSESFVSFQGEGTLAGRRQLFLRLAGCNLRCRYCDTPDSLERVPTFRVWQDAHSSRSVPNPLTPAAALEAVLPLLSGERVDGMAITGGEPLLQAEFLQELLADPRLPRPRLLETNGMLPESLATVLPQIDVVSMDIKLPSNSGERAFWDAHARFLARAGSKAYVKILIDAATAMSDVERAADIVRQEAPRAAVFLQPITDTAGRIDLNADTLTRFHATVRRHLADVRVLPQAHKMLAIQ